MNDTARGNSSPRGVWRRAAIGAAAAAGAFSVVVCALVLSYSYWSEAADPMDSDEMVRLKRALLASPGDEALRQEIRALDLRLREEFFARQRRVAMGGRLLAGGAALTLICLLIAGRLGRRPPCPRGEVEDRDGMFRRAALSSLAVAAVAAGLGAAAGVAVFSSADDPSLSAAETAAGTAPAPTQPAADIGPVDAARQWPRFRGPGGLGVAAFDDLPTDFDGRTGKGIRWKTPVLLPGNNSPVVWGRHVFLAGATKTKRELYCFDADSGELLWARPVKPAGSPPQAPEVMEDTGYAAPTAATDGEVVCAVFANGDLAAFDFRGRELWSRPLGLPESAYGYAASLLMHNGLLVVQFDQGPGGEASKSELIAFHAGTGKVAWSTPRPVGNSWSTPIVIDVAGGRQIVTAASPWAIAYRPDGGKEIWRADVLGGDVAPSPTFAGGLVFVANTGAYLAAIRPDGQGNVTETHVAWKAEDGLPDICSPLADGRRVYLLETGGYLTCYDAKGGKLWEHEFGETFKASPSLIGRRVCLLSTGGTFWFVAAADAFKQLATAELGEKSVTTPAFARGRMYVRGEKHLICIGPK